MSYPIPQYKDEIPIGEIVAGENNDSYEDPYQTMLTASYEALVRYIRRRTLRLADYAEDMGDGNNLTHFVGQTPNDIVVKLNASTEQDTGHPSGRIPNVVSIELSSFQTPTDPLRQELTDIVQQACKSLTL